MGGPVRRRHLPRPLGGGWVFTKRSWFLFFLREITCIFVGLFALLTIHLIRSVAEGPEAYAAFLAWLRKPPVVAFHFLSLGFLVFHTVTWFVAAPKAMRPRVGARLVPARTVVGAHYALWIATSATVFWILL